MKKVFAPLVALIPVFYVLLFALFVLIDPSDNVLLGIYVAFLVASVLASILFAVFAGAHSRKSLALYNILFAAGNLLILIGQIVYWYAKLAEINGATENQPAEGLLLFFVLLIFYIPHWVSYGIVRIVGMVANWRTLRGICPNGINALHTALHFFPLADLISSVIVLLRVRAWEKKQNSSQ